MFTFISTFFIRKNTTIICFLLYLYILALIVNKLKKENNLGNIKQSVKLILIKYFLKSRMKANPWYRR